ncbi:similar to Saccharomyces cerevisiae YDR350C ATP22 Specific translational activator for the mitochondrial ATP6 mRNA, encoding a subunit of F1F0 ATP synthase [Maudiozyma saulgeensis]|uniref:Similar to Saccharomyces cerevisiae YDR350C ATP22 Specific translational activator for the mitochondrial ATP6 mRNA, encoding a subunit of F1F0 ATP synthase n=1 Tax=Maudiozyma saulgeensis TaxID=1789683 RepID=A0A1X7R2L4_9SACH|nr:similar to Saccharomyces cerevisiae YDR350C ATP22 Specific translational activator for the mitochondrial ATP6 mRNA, encoding a subunit of F1F0 ATP synthase [Kazachstania saulgeensis]
MNLPRRVLSQREWNYGRRLFLTAVRGNSTKATMATTITTGIDIVTWLKTLPRESLLKQKSLDLARLGRWFVTAQDVKGTKMVKDLLMTQFPEEYNKIENNLINTSDNPFYLNMILQSRVSRYQYKLFTDYLQLLLDRSDQCTIEKTAKSLYEAIYAQNTLFSSTKPGASLVVPDVVHKWFYMNLPKTSSFQHYMFLIQNDVNLSAGEYSRLFTTRLIQGSELEYQLVTFDYFLLRPEEFPSPDITMDKFVKLHNFYDMYNIINLTIKKNKKDTLSQSNLSFYLQALVKKLSHYKSVTSQGGNDNGKQLAIQFVKFAVQMLAITAKLEDTKQFTSLLNSLIIFMKNTPYIDEASFGKLMHRPIVQIFRLLRVKRNQDAIFQLASSLGDLTKIPKTFMFKNMILNELVLSLRYFNDPKLMCQFLVSAIKKPDPGQLLNDLGLWGTIFHSTNGRKLSIEVLRKDIQGMSNLIPSSLYGELEELSLPLSELYSSIFSTSSLTMSKQSYREFLIQLYMNYVIFMEANFKKRYLWKNDSRIIKCFISSVLSHLADKTLAYELLLDFYSKPFAKKIRNKGKDCPFSIVLYDNLGLTPIQVEKVLTCMEQNNIPLTFKICTSMILRYLKWGDIETAHSWYNKIIDCKFPIMHRTIVSVAAQYNWVLPEELSATVLENNDMNAGVNNFEDEINSLMFDEDDTSDDNVHNLLSLVKQI